MRSVVHAADLGSDNPPDETAVARRRRIDQLSDRNALRQNDHVASRRADAATILVVEDDPEARELYRVALMAGGYAVVAVRDGVDALRVMEQHAPAAVVLDLGLLGLSGADVAQEMSAQPPLSAVPIIIVTGDASGIDPTRFACVLHKPINPVDLIDAVTRCLSSSSR